MHGIIMLTVKDLVVTKFGEKVWLQIVAQAKCPADFVSNQPYDDAVVYDLLKAGTTVLKAKPEDLLEQIGYWFIVYVHSKTKYGQLLEMIGSDLGDALSHINKLHAHLLKVAHFPTIVSPTFKVTHRKGNSLRLHYTPGKESRQGLSPLVVGLVKGLAIEMLKLKEVNITQIKTKEANGSDVFEVVWHSDAESDGRDSATATDTTAHVKMPLKYGLNSKALGRLLPFHIMFDKECNIIQAGESLQKIVPLEAGDPMSQFFSIKEPVGCSFPNFKAIFAQRKLSPFTLVHTYDEETTFTLHGEMVWCKTKQTMCYACTPVLSSIEEARYLGIDISDFPLCDQAQASLMASHAAVARVEATTAGDATAPDAAWKDRQRSSSGTRIFLKSIFGGPGPRVRKKGETDEEFRVKRPYHSAESGAIPECTISGIGSVESSPVLPRVAKVRIPSTNSLDQDGIERLRARAHTGSSSSSASPRESWSGAASFGSGPERLLHVFSEALLEDSWADFPLIRTLLELDMTEVTHRGGHDHQLSEAIVSFYSIKGKAQHLLASSFVEQIANSPKEEGTVLFREDSIAVRLFKAFIRQQATGYIDCCISNLLRTVDALDRPLEVDPRNVSSAEVAKNCKQLLAIAQAFLEHVCKTAARCPAPVRRVLRVVEQEVGKRWPEMNLQAVANLLFLRFLSPAIVSPNRVKGTSQRTLMLITKLLNNLANNVQFGDKEPYMAPLNAFISPDNLLLVQQFMQEFVSEERIICAAAEGQSQRGGADHAELGERYRLLASLDEIKRSLLRLLPSLYSAAASRPKLQHVMQRLISVFLCELPTE